MEDIQKKPEQYLEKKREFFPRFYFISNDELLQILANQTDLKAIEKQAKKCFENVNTFFLQDELAKEQIEQREEAIRLEQLRLEKKRKTDLTISKEDIENLDFSNTKKRTTIDEVISPDKFVDEIIDTSELNNIYGLLSIEGERFKFHQNKFQKIRQ